MTSDWITTFVASKISGYHHVHIRRLLLSGRIKGKKWGTQWQISKSSLLRYLEQRKQSGKKRGPKAKQ
jgi:excisionase family DNA binding protein